MARHEIDPTTEKETAELKSVEETKRGERERKEKGFWEGKGIASVEDEGGELPLN